MTAKQVIDYIENQFREQSFVQYLLAEECDAADIEELHDSLIEYGVLDEVSDALPEEMYFAQLATDYISTDQAHIVLHFEKLNIYLQVSAWLDSYGNGNHEFGSISQVYPKQVTTIIYTNERN